MNKILNKVFVVMLTLTIFILPAYAAPSDWAQEIVSEAEAMSAVPQSVRQDY